jgi:molybdopterin-guanine dinucleotide biosynthesis protein A
LLSACAVISAEHIFAVAGDAPDVTSDVLERLATAWQPGDEAVVPEHDGRDEPLAALYSKAALEREGYAVLASDDASMHALLRRLRVRRIALSSEYFHNVNTVADLK